MVPVAARDLFLLDYDRRHVWLRVHFHHLFSHPVAGITGQELQLT